MKAYRITIEGAFFRLPGIELTSYHGFFTTFNVEASRAIDAVFKVRKLLLARLQKHHVVICNGFVFSSHCSVSNIWEIDLETYEEDKEIDLGFIFYKIGLINTITLLIKKVYLRAMKKNFIVNIMNVSENDQGRMLG